MENRLATSRFKKRVAPARAPGVRAASSPHICAPMSGIHRLSFINVSVFVVACVLLFNKRGSLVQRASTFVHHGYPSSNLVEPKAYAPVSQTLERPNDLIVHAEWDFMLETADLECSQVHLIFSDEVSNASCPSKPRVVNMSPCICDWLALSKYPSCPVIGLLGGDENYGALDPAPLLHYPADIAQYQGCTTWEKDIVSFKNLLDSPSVLAVFYRQTPPLVHGKVYLVPLGPSRQFMEALRKREQLLSGIPRHRLNLYYVNHSPWAHRSAIFLLVNRIGFDGKLHNEFCTDACDSDIEQSKFLDGLMTSYFVQSPPGKGEDCYRHYEVMLAGAFPVVRRSFSFGVFGNLPHVSVDDWAQVNPIYLESELAKLR